MALDGVHGLLVVFQLALQCLGATCCVNMRFYASCFEPHFEVLLVRHVLDQLVLRSGRSVDGLLEIRDQRLLEVRAP